MILIFTFCLYFWDPFSNCLLKQLLSLILLQKGFMQHCCSAFMISIPENNNKKFCARYPADLRPMQEIVRDSEYVTNQKSVSIRKCFVFWLTPNCQN